MMTLRRIFGLILLFLFFEAVVAVVTTVFFEQVNVLLACLSMTGLAVGTWVAIFFLARLITHRPPKPASPAKVVIAAESMSSPGDDSFMLEFASLLSEANRRLQALTSAQSNRVVPTVHSLPLYLVIGSEGSGKTSVIVNSGLEPRLLAGDARNDGQAIPTSAANFWFAEGAVFVEISGRLLMQEPARWEKALRLLSETKRLPWWKLLAGANSERLSNLRGVLVICETEAFLQSRDPRRLATISRTLNERLQMVQAVLRVDFPAYVIFTKLDSIPNFQELFSHLTDVEARQILGITLPLAVPSALNSDGYADREGSRTSRFFDRLYQSVGDKRLALLVREDSVEKRARAYEFPRELKKLRGELVQFLVDVFRPSSLHSACRLRGFYFSAKRLVPRTEISASVDSVNTASFRPSLDATVIFTPNASAPREFSAQGIGLADTSKPKWTFLTDLFRDVILTDPAGRATQVPIEGRDSRNLNLALGATGAVLLLLSVLWGVSWRQNHRLLTQVEAAVLKTGEAPAQDALESLRELESLRHQMVRLHSHDGAPGLSYHWGLYSGARAATDLDRLYFARLRMVVLDPALVAMTAHFLQPRETPGSAGDFYGELKSYRTITSGSCATDDALVASNLIRVWNEAISRDTEEQALAENQIRFYASRLKLGDPYDRSIPESGPAVLKAQIYLQELTGAEKILQSVLDQVQPRSMERLSAYANNYSQVLTGPDEVEAQFTPTGWNVVQERIRQHQLMSNGEPCVVGTPGKGATGNSAMETQVQRLYGDAYIQIWKLFLQAHHVAEFAGPVDAAQKLHTLADNNRSPLLALLYMTSVNTNVAVPPTLRERASSVVSGAATTWTNTIRRMAGGTANAGTKQAEQQSFDELSVQTAFHPLHVAVDPAARDKWLNERNQPYMKALGDMGDALQALPSQIDTDAPLEMQQLERARAALGEAESALHALSGNFPNGPRGIDVDLENLLREPIDHARRVVLGVHTVNLRAKAALPPAPVVDLSLKPTIEHLNAAAVRLCSALAPVVHKFPFDASSSSDVSLEELNQLLQPGSGAYPVFSNLPEVSKAYNHSGRIWAQKPEFPATYSQPFVITLNGFGELHDVLYGATGDAPHVEYSVTIDGTGKVPFQLEIDGHVLKHSPGHPTPPLHLIWPPITSSPAQLTIKNGGRKSGGVQTGAWSGPWALFHLLQSADEQSGNVFTFRTVEFRHSLNPLAFGKATPGTIQIRVDSPAGNIFGRGFFSKLRCNEDWAVRQLGPGAN